MEANRQIDLEVKQQLEEEASISNRSVPSDFQSPKVLQEDLQKKTIGKNKRLQNIRIKYI